MSDTYYRDLSDVLKAVFSLLIKGMEMSDEAGRPIAIPLIEQFNNNTISAEALGYQLRVVTDNWS